MKFEEKFPSLKFKSVKGIDIMRGEIYNLNPYIKSKDIEKHCLDKQKVIEVIEKFESKDVAFIDFYKLRKELGLWLKILEQEENLKLVLIGMHKKVKEGLLPKELDDLPKGVKNE